MSLGVQVACGDEKLSMLLYIHIEKALILASELIHLKLLYSKEQEP